ncbi:hypothetical protein BDK51DRAFT_44764 [Blyttiomyces helicus]|uniref:Uncharacterized protein n=1 Tax=Blyttiomyces helicus TaxID=388810 RepID=A0A4P9WQI0_9FUNG|nr:hypothetical protein BDK51DRAFT_44764 [Blyttiomyces helicus]|eukprot:RKO93470.1 hypothetical protein BDK51DRAFT_44764 [Blyttiomyces helicus]
MPTASPATDGLPLQAPPNAHASGGKECNNFAKLLTYKLRICSEAYDSDCLSRELEKMELAVNEKGITLNTSDKKSMRPTMDMPGFPAVDPKHRHYLLMDGGWTATGYGQELVLDSKSEDSAGQAKGRRSGSLSCRLPDNEQWTSTNETLHTKGPRRGLQGKTPSIFFETLIKTTTSPSDAFHVLSDSQSRGAAASGFHSHTGSQILGSSCETADPLQNPITPYSADGGLTLRMSTSPTLPLAPSANDDFKSSTAKLELSHSGKGVKKNVTIVTLSKEIVEAELVLQSPAPYAESAPNDEGAAISLPRLPDRWSASLSEVFPHEPSPATMTCFNQEEAFPHIQPSCSYSNFLPDEQRIREILHVQSTSVPSSPVAPPPPMASNAPSWTPSKRWATDSSRMTDRRRTSVVDARPVKTTGAKDMTVSHRTQ